MKKSHTRQRFARRTSAVALTLLLAACAGSPTPQRSSHIEIEENVGFTITVDARVSSNVRSEYEAAILLLEQGNEAAGIARLEAVTAEAPELSAPLIDLGIARHRAGDLEAAERNLKRALALDPGHPIAHNELGIIYRRTGRFDAARTSYEAALAIYPGYHFARRNLAVLCDLYLADRACALENYKAYMATVPSDEEAAMWIADLQNRSGD
jgi:Flp pilus assembly protein TadD